MTTESAEGPGWADRRLSFGAGADDYDRFRPTYPDAAVRWCAGAPGGRVVDVGSGTGRFAIACARLGYDVLAVEPDDRMRVVAEQALPGRTVAGSAEALPLPDASVDTVTAAQAYHWFDPEPAHAEIARVLRPGGHLAVLWNTRDDRVPWVEELSTLIGGEDRYTAVESQGAPPFGGQFDPAECTTWQHLQVLTVDAFVGLVGSFSYVRLRPDCDAVLDAVRALVTDHPGLAGSGAVEVPYVTRAYRAVRRPGFRA